MDSPRLTRPWLAFAIGVPLAWAVLLLFHPTGEGESITYADIQDKVTPWMVVHVGMLFFIPLIAVAIYLLLRGSTAPPRGSRGLRSCHSSWSTAPSRRWWASARASSCTR